jgi:hypothetical protein
MLVQLGRIAAAQYGSSLERRTQSKTDSSLPEARTNLRPLAKRAIVANLANSIFQKTDLLRLIMPKVATSRCSCRLNFYMKDESVNRL